jgi:hypothetical protein
MPGRFRVRRFVLGLLLAVVAAYVIWDRVEARRLARDIAAIAARGEPVDFGYWYARQVTAEQREAATLYAQAAEFATEAESGQPYQASMLDVDKADGRLVPLEDMAASYRHDAPAMQLLDRATPMDFTEFGESNRELFVNQIPLQRLGAQACLRADLVAVRGDGETAAAALVPCIRLQRTLLPNYRFQHALRILGSLRILFRHTQPADASLVMLQRHFETWPDDDGAIRSLLQDRVRFIETAEDGFRGMGPSAARFLFHPFLVRNTRRGLASYEPAMATARQSWLARRQAAAAVERDYMRMARDRGFFSRLIDPFPAGFMGLGRPLAVQDVCVRRITVAVLAAERFRRAHGGALPASLDALVPEFLAAVPIDPYTEKPLEFRRAADGYVVYSVDSNRRDDGGALYGHGSAVTKHVGPQSPRDVGIHVPLKPVQ